MNSIQLACKYYENVLAMWPDNFNDVIETQFTLDWLLDQRYCTHGNITVPLTEEIIEDLFTIMPRYSVLTIDNLPDCLWDAGDITIRNRDLKVKRNLIRRNVYYYHKGLHTYTKYAPAVNCPQPFDEPILMVTVQDIINECTEMFHWKTEVSEQRMAAFIYDIACYESQCGADKLDILMYHINSMLDTFGTHCSISKFFDIGNLDDTLERTANNVLLRQRTNTDKYIYRTYLVHTGE